MKKLIQITASSLAILVLLTTGSNTEAAIGDKAYQKLKESVDNASPDDWRLYAESAQKLIRGKDHLNEAKEWIEKSLEVSETPYNLEVYGDYYAANNLYKEAVEQYYKSMQLAKETNPNGNYRELQDKMYKAKQKSMGKS